MGKKGTGPRPCDLCAGFFIFRREHMFLRPKNRYTLLRVLALLREVTGDEVVVRATAVKDVQHIERIHLLANDWRSILYPLYTIESV